MPDLWMNVDANLTEVPVNILPLLDDTDFKTRETGIVYNQAGMDLVWNFTTTAGAFTQTAVTPTTSGDYDWTHQGDGMYTIEIPASGGASINNNTEGFGWFTGLATGVLPWRGPVIGFRASGLNDALIDNAYSTTRGLAGTALPAAAADAAGGLPISDAGGLDLDTMDSNVSAILTDTGTTLPATLGTPADTDLATDIANVAASLGAIRVNKNTALANFEFLMTDSTNHAPSAGLTVTATRSIDGGAFAACANAVTELSNGIYVINLAAADLNGDVITLRFTAAASDDTLITIVTQA